MLFLRQESPYSNESKVLLLIFQNHGQVFDINYPMFREFYYSNILIFSLQKFIRICDTNANQDLNYLGFYVGEFSVENFFSRKNVDPV
jgi:hypothetical protein